MLDVYGCKNLHKHVWEHPFSRLINEMSFKQIQNKNSFATWSELEPALFKLIFQNFESQNQSDDPEIIFAVISHTTSPSKRGKKQVDERPKINESSASLQSTRQDWTNTRCMQQVLHAMRKRAHVYTAYL